MCCMFSLENFCHRNSDMGGQIIRDSEQNVANTSVSFNNGITTVSFSRLKNTGDENDFSLDVCRYFFFAWGDVNDIKTGEINSPGMVHYILDNPICLPTSTSLCPEISKLWFYKGYNDCCAFSQLWATGRTIKWNSSSYQK